MITDLSAAIALAVALKSQRDDLLALVNEARELMPLGTAKRSAWLSRSGVVVAKVTTSTKTIESNHSEHSLGVVPGRNAS